MSVVGQTARLQGIPDRTGVAEKGQLETDAIGVLVDTGHLAHGIIIGRDVAPGEGGTQIFGDAGLRQRVVAQPDQQERTIRCDEHGKAKGRESTDAQRSEMFHGKNFDLIKGKPAAASRNDEPGAAGGPKRRRPGPHHAGVPIIAIA
jgi:hypothetical protein